MEKMREKWKSAGFDLHSEHLLAQHLSGRTRVFVGSRHGFPISTIPMVWGGGKRLVLLLVEGTGWVQIKSYVLLISVRVGGGFLGNFVHDICSPIL